MKPHTLALLALLVAGCDQSDPARYLSCRTALANAPNDSARLAVVLDMPPGTHLAGQNTTVRPCAAYLGGEFEYNALVRQLDSLTLTLKVKRGVLNTLEDTTYHNPRNK